MRSERPTRKLRTCSKKVKDLLDGQSFSTDDPDIPSHEPEVIEVDSKVEHDKITEFEEPSLAWDERYDPDKQGMDQANGNSIQGTVVQNGPIKYDTAMQTYLDVWGQSRAGQKVQRIFRNRLNELKRQDKVHEHGEFLWPPLDELEFDIRINTDSDTRTIDEIPPEEIAKAITVVLREGGAIEEDDIVLEDGSMDVYRKKQQWDAASLPDPVISPLRNYRKLIDPSTDRWPVFPTLDQRTLGELVQKELADRGARADTIDERRGEYARDLLLALDEDIRPPSITTDGARLMLQRLSTAAEIDIDHLKHDYLAPHGGRRGMGEVLVRAFGYTVAARYLDNSEEMVRERYSHIEAGALGDVATEALDVIDKYSNQRKLK